MAFGLTTASTALAAPAGGKPPDNPFDERSAGSEAAGEAESGDQPKKPAAETSKPPAPTRDEPVTSDAEEPGDDSAGQKDEDEEEEGSLHALACLEGDTADGKRKGVQRRDFLKKHRFEIGGLNALAFCKCADFRHLC